MAHHHEQTKLIALRTRIDQIDRQIVECLAQRDQCIENLVPLKNTEAVLDTPREKVVIESRSRWAAQMELEPELAAQFFSLVMKHRAECLKALRPASDDKPKPIANTEKTSKPLVYSCSGCSNLAQLANQLALTLDRDGIAEMSCIAGIGGGVSSLVNKAKSAEQIIALDGCLLHCVKHCLARHDITPTQHYTLTELGLKKRPHKAFEQSEFDKVQAWVMADLQKK